MKIIDSHAHIFPDKIAVAAAKATMHFYETCRTPIPLTGADLIHHNGTIGELKEEMKKAGIEKSLVFSAATAASQVESINSFIIRSVKDDPDFYGAGTMHVEYDKFEEECDRIKAAGLLGIKLHPDIQQFQIDDDRLFELYEVMSDRHMFLITHAGDNRYDYSVPTRVKRVADNFPKLKIIGAHFAGWSQWEEARQILKLDNIYMDTSSTIQYAGPQAAIKGFETFDNTHIFFGSDYPMWNPKEELQTILDLNLSDDLLEKVLHQNFEDFIANL